MGRFFDSFNLALVLAEMPSAWSDLFNGTITLVTELLPTSTLEEVSCAYKLENAIMNKIDKNDFADMRRFIISDASA